MRLEVNRVDAYRPDTPRLYPRGVFSNNSEILVLAMPSIGGQIRGLVMTIPGTTSTDTPLYMPGDGIVVKLARRANDAQDTCVGDLFILSMSASF